MVIRPRRSGHLGGRRAIGGLVADVLAGSWREHPPPLDALERQLDHVAPMLLETGAGGLGWWRARHSGATESDGARRLRDGYRLHSLHAAVLQRQVKAVSAALQAARVDAILFKGWSVARLYPDAGLRPYGDIDLWAPPPHGRVWDALRSLRGNGAANVDVHDTLGETLAGRSFDDVFARSRLVQLDGVDVRVLAPEDHLHLLCMHFLLHAAWRPLWLCDIAASIETLPEEFDWELSLGRDPRRARWITCTVALAGELLAAETSRTPVPAGTLPRWIAPAVVRQWSVPPSEYPRSIQVRPMASYLRRPRGALRAVRVRWPNPVEATVRVRGPFNGLPRLPFQAWFIARRAARLIPKAAAVIRDRRAGEPVVRGTSPDAREQLRDLPR